MAEIVDDQQIREQALRDRIQADLLRQDKTGQVPILTNRIERATDPSATYFNPTEMETARTWGSKTNPSTGETYTGLPAISEMKDGSGYGMGAAGLNVYQTATDKYAPEGSTRQGGYDVINQAPMPTEKPQQEQRMATFNDAIGLAESKFGIKMGDDPYELARQETDAEAAQALQQYFPGKTLATLNPQELKLYQSNYAQVLNQKTSQKVAQHKDMVEFAKTGLNYINENHKRTNEELRAELARIKEEKKDSKPKLKPTNVTFKDGTEGTANFDEKSGNYYDPATKEDISANVQLKSIKKPSISIPALKKLVTEAGEEPDSNNIDLINKAAEEHGLEYKEITPAVENPWYLPNKSAKWGLVKIGKTSEPKKPTELKKLTPDIIKQIKSKAKTREEAEKMATEMGYDIGA